MYGLYPYKSLLILFCYFRIPRGTFLTQEFEILQFNYLKILGRRGREERKASKMHA